MSPSSVGRIWPSEKVQPHRVRTFKLSNDREFADKTDDIVTLYLYPPANSVVWSADEQCQLQALSRTQFSLPCVPGHDVTKTAARDQAPMRACTSSSLQCPTTTLRFSPSRVAM